LGIFNSPAEVRRPETQTTTHYAATRRPLTVSVLAQVVSALTSVKELHAFKKPISLGR
jgi:hypothetical protein